MFNVFEVNIITSSVHKMLIRRLEILQQIIQDFSSMYEAKYSNIDKVKFVEYSQ